MNKSIPKRTIAAAAPAAILLGGCASSSHDDINTLLAGIAGAIAEKAYDGTTDDLLTGASSARPASMGAAPAYAVPPRPPRPNQRNAIYNNYRALVDYTAAGGMGKLYGPNIDLNGGNTLGEGKIAGREYIATADDGTGQQNVTLMVQAWLKLDAKKPCIVTATSSGSRGVYGAIGTAGEWGLPAARSPTPTRARATACTT